MKSQFAIIPFVIVFVFVIAMAFDFLAAKPEDTNYDEKQVPEYVLPDPLIDEQGKAVVNKQQWMKHRRGEIMRLFEESVYGKTPSKQIGQAKYECNRSGEVRMC